MAEQEVNNMNKTNEVKATKTVGERGRFMIPVFQDEYALQGIEDGMTLGEARVHVRTALGFENPARQKVGSVNGKIRANLKEATQEQKDAIAKILGV